MKALLLLFLASNLLSQAEITRGPYLQLSHATGVTVVWRSDEELSDATVQCWRPNEKAPLTPQKKVLMRSKSGAHPLSEIPEGQVQYEVQLSGLPIDTTFRYALFDGETALTSADENLHFTTHPKIGEETPTRIWVVGDSGTGQQHQRDVHSAMQTYTAGEPIDLYLHVGDMAYTHGTDREFQDKFFEPYQETLQHKVCWASMGNHEGKSSNGKTGVGPYYDAYVCPTKGEAGGMPSGTEAFYSFDYGNIHVICLDSYDLDRSPDGEMAQWLVKDLAQTQAKWILGFWHHPPYTKGSHDSDSEVELIEMREHIMPLLEAGGVDLVLSGHSHIYERSMLIDGAYQTPTTAEGVVLDDGDGNPKGDGPYRKSGEVTPHNGTVALVTGHGGALVRKSKGILPLMRSIVLDHGSTILDIEGDTLTGVMLDLRGKERDRFQILKNGKVEQSIVSNPQVATKETEERTGSGVMGSPRTKRDARAARKAGEKNVAQMMPTKFSPLIAPNAEWDYLGSGATPETEMWTKVGFDAKEEGWLRGPAGFGYGDGDDRTVLNDMMGEYSTLFIRREFEIPAGTDKRRIGLAINYDDGFALFLNGKEVMAKFLRRLENEKVEVSLHEAEGPEYFPLSAFAEFLKDGKNVIAIEGHNVSPTSSDFSLDPFLVIAGDS